MAQSNSMGTKSVKNSGGMPNPHPSSNRMGSNSPRVASTTGPRAASGGNVMKPS